MKTQLKAALIATALTAFGPMASMAGAPAVTPGFQGWYIGAHAAYEFGDADIASDGAGSGPAFTFGDDVDGWGAGMQLGYNHVMGRWLLGAEVSATGLEVDGVSVHPQPAAIETEYNWRADITARLGYLVTDKTALYIEGGWSVAEIDVHSVTNLGPLDQVNNEDTVDGWTAGIGIEHQLNDGVSAFVEYSYTDYGTEKFVDVNSGNGISHDNQLQAIKIGVNFQLN